MPPTRAATAVTDRPRAIPTADRFGNPDGALLFDGVDDHVSISPPPPLRESFSVSVWARVDTGQLGGWTNCLVCQDDGNDARQSRRVFQISLLNGRMVWHRMTRVEDPVSRGLVIPGTWVHAAAVVDRGRHRLYVDGVLHDSARDLQRVHPDEPLYLGRKGTNEPSFFFRGAIDDLRLYDRALAAPEVRTLFEGAASGRASSRDRSRAAGRRAAEHTAELRLTNATGVGRGRQATRAISARRPAN